MRVLVLYAHPVETSFNAAMHKMVVQTLREAGHEVDDCDLYAEGFDAVLSRQERLSYHKPATRRFLCGPGFEHRCHCHGSSDLEFWPPGHSEGLYGPGVPAGSIV